MNCPICGTTLPAQIQRCGTCQADLAYAASLDYALQAPVSTAAPAVPRPQPLSKDRYWRAAKKALIWGLIDGAIMAVVLGTLMHLLFSDSSSYSPLISGLDFGSLVGFMIGSIWGLTSALELDMGKAAIAGAVLGAAETLHHHFTEWILFAEPDMPAYLIGLMGCGAGAVAGICSVFLREFREQ